MQAPDPNVVQLASDARTQTPQYPVPIVGSDHYLQDYDAAFAQRFDEYINWERRAAGEGRFFVDQLKQYHVKTVLDVACGTGFHAVRLSQAGFDVTGVDGSPEMLKQARDNAESHGVSFPTICVDWRDLGTAVTEQFDALICLGNSLTYLLPGERPDVLKQFCDRLKPGGTLLIDHRNYDAICRRGVEHFRYKGEYNYCGDSPPVPEYIDDSQTLFRVCFADGVEFTTCMFPVWRYKMQEDLHRAGFNPVIEYGDFDSATSDESDFFLHVAKKRTDASYARP